MRAVTTVSNAVQQEAPEPDTHTRQQPQECQWEEGMGECGRTWVCLGV